MGEDEVDIVEAEAREALLGALNDVLSREADIVYTLAALLKLNITNITSRGVGGTLKILVEMTRSLRFHTPSITPRSKMRPRRFSASPLS